MSSIHRRGFLLASLAAAAAPSVLAQEFPRQRIRIIVGFPPGGGLDASARIIAAHMAKVLNQSVIVENRPGASGTLAAGVIKNSAPDGYELLLAETAPMEISPFVMKKIGYDSITDFTHIGMFAASPGAALVANATKAPRLHTMADFIREAKANPGKLSYGSSGAGSAQSLTVEYFCAGMGLEVLHVPYRGGGASVPAVLAGDVNLAVSSIHAILPHVQSGKLNMLATTGARRYKGTPNTPTFGEFFKEYEACTSEFGLMAPANLPAEVQNKLAGALQNAVQDPDVIAKLAAVQYETAWLAPAAYRNHMQANLRKYEKIVRMAKLQPE